MTDELTVTVLGREIGTASAWDECDTLCFQFYDFVPAEGVSLDKCESLTVFFDRGMIEGYKNNEVIFSKEGLDVIRDLKK